ncbi:peroxisomal N(1)-acetyl-spermine/spermidine oxidase isoform X2 [Eurytemora carolleeae]|uniref:peroxisomal N(1)-acetyl-spermine/spermidine oxidase isoform X2 n=1 Tax=Eurytemora carolleeae TaxID=1294199 RepID=UPI000C78799A|nr:peroxisomal N(1)-acetyl-spermine/spermidine oxidase isoform X2 [Eurytemora carolleeae]|eukprot:XP_023337296.1 peroxisomal N(1)-acetyl-spermine/spermidine oxidase-like isoform X2 [Eurytemora affinis]
MSGVYLSAAVRFKEHGIKTILLEAKNRIGGRIFTDGKLELGAQWIHGGCPGNPLFNYASTKKLLGSKVKRVGDDQEDDYPTGYFYTSQGRIIDRDISNKAWDIYENINDETEFSFKNAEPSLQGQSLGEFYKKRVKEEIRKLKKDDYSRNEMKDIEMVVESLSLMLAGYLGDSLEEASLYLYGSSEELPGEDVVVPDGLNSIINALAQDMDSNFELEKPVEKIKWSSEGVEVVTKDRVYNADHAIVTVPIGVLQTQDLFSPQLDDKKKRGIENMRGGRISKIFLEFDKPFWNEGEGNINFVWTKKDIDGANLPEEWFKTVNGFDEVEGTNDTLIMWVVGSAAEYVDKLGDKEILEQAGKLLRRFTGDPALSLPNKVRRHPWLADPYALGTWSYPSIYSTHQDYKELSTPLPSPTVPRLLLAGEHVHPQYWSFMHGARLSGIEQADKIAEFMKK